VISDWRSVFKLTNKVFDFLFYLGAHEGPWEPWVGRMEIRRCTKCGQREWRIRKHG